MRLKSHKYIMKGILLLLLCLMITSVSASRPDNTIYPLYNYFAFGKDGTITRGLHNQSFVSKEGMKIHEVTSEQDVYKFRFIFKTPKKPFDVLSMRVKALFTRNTSGFIRWGGLHNVTISVFPFELVTIDGNNNSVQVLNGRDLYQGANIQFKFNTSAFEEVEYFELGFSSWNSTESLRGVQFEQIHFHRIFHNYLSETILLVLGGSVSIFSLAIYSPRKFGILLTFLITAVLVIVPMVIIIRTQSYLSSLPQIEEGVDRFTFFGRVYERRDLGNGLFSLQMVKDLSKAFELKALSGTGSQVVYPQLEIESITEEIEIQIETESGNTDSSKIQTEESTTISNTPSSSFNPFFPFFGAGLVQIDISNISITDSDSGVVHSNRKYYSFEVIVSDQDGYGDLEFVQLNFTVNSFEYSVGYDNGTNTFSEINDDGADHITLGGGSSTSRNGNYLTVTFKIQTDWDLPNENNVALTAWANDTSSNYDETTSTATYNFNHDIEVASFSVDNNNINPNYASNLVFTGNVYYQGAALSVPTDEIDVVTIFRNDTPSDINVAIVNDTDALVSISVDSETIVGNYTYYPYVELAGDGSDFNGSATTTQEVHVDCVKITNIAVQSDSYEHFDGSRYWDNNNASFDDIIIVITAVWNFTGNPYQGEVNIGYSGNEDIYGASSGLTKDIEEDPASGTSITRDGITVGSAVIGAGNDYGIQVYTSQVPSFPNTGWDNAAPSGYSVTMDSGWFYADITNDSSPTCTGNVGSATDVGSGIHDTSPYNFRHRVDGGSWTYRGWSSVTTYTPSIGASTQDFDVEMDIRDNVGNVAGYTIAFDHDNVVDLLAPSFSNIGGSEASEWLHAPGATTDYGYYSDNMGLTLTNFNVIGDVTDNIGLEKANGSLAFSDTPQDITITSTSDSFFCTYTINNGDFGSGTQVVTIYLYDQGGNFVTDTFTFYEDNSPPTLSDAMSDYAESGDTDEVYNDSISNTFYFSNSFDSSATITFTATGSDNGPSGVRGIDFGVFGADNPTEDTSFPYQGQYTIDTTDELGSILVTIYDNVGNSDSNSITCTEDSAIPNIILTEEAESSDHLYAEHGDGSEGVYGSGMSSGESYTISGTASDGSSGMFSVTDDTTFGGNPSNGGSPTSWNFEYSVTSSDDGDVTVTYTATDNVGNTNTTTYTFYEDNTDPTITDVMADYLEISGDLDEVHGDVSSNIFYFSGSFDGAPATIIFNATGTDTGVAGLRGIDFGAFSGEDPPEDPSPPYSGQYSIDGTENSGFITVDIYDNV
ncbi:MAG: hypothetical protein JSW11_19430, partial [Candidatus Heimdallarchaeota archaeon]